MSGGAGVGVGPRQRVLGSTRRAKSAVGRLFALLGLHPEHLISRRYYIAVVSYCMFTTLLLYVNGQFRTDEGDDVRSYLAELALCVWLSLLVLPMLAANYSTAWTALVMSVLSFAGTSACATYFLWDLIGTSAPYSRMTFRSVLIVHGGVTLFSILNSRRSYHNALRRERRKQLAMGALRADNPRVPSLPSATTKAKSTFQAALKRSQRGPAPSPPQRDRAMAEAAEVRALEDENARLTRLIRWQQLQILRNASRIHAIHQAQLDAERAEEERVERERVAAMPRRQRVWYRATRALKRWVPWAKTDEAGKVGKLGLASLVGEANTLVFSPEETKANDPVDVRQQDYWTVTVTDARIVTGIVLGLLLCAYTGSSLSVSAARVANGFQEGAADFQTAIDIFVKIQNGTIAVGSSVDQADVDHLIVYFGVLFDLFHNFADTYRAAAVVGALVGMGCVLAAAPATMRAYKRQVIAMHRGLDGDAQAVKHSFDDITATNNFVGIQTSSSITSFMLVWTVVTFCVMLGLFKPIQSIATASTRYIGSYISLLLIQRFLDKRVEKRLLDQKQVKNTNLWFLYENAMMFLGVLTGAFSAMTRFCYVLAFAAVSLARLDFSMLPPHLWSFDPGFVSFCSIVAMDHTHRAPLLVLAARLLQQRTVCSRARKRWWLASLLVRNPLLANLRKHRIAAQGAGLEGECDEVA